MGFFSYNCKECNHSILSRHSTNEGINEWMSHVVVLGSDGSRIDGEYDGYGRVEDEEIDEDEDRVVAYKIDARCARDTLTAGAMVCSERAVCYLV